MNTTIEKGQAVFYHTVDYQIIKVNEINHYDRVKINKSEIEYLSDVIFTVRGLLGNFGIEEFEEYFSKA